MSFLAARFRRTVLDGTGGTEACPAAASTPRAQVAVATSLDAAQQLDLSPNAGYLQFRDNARAREVVATAPRAPDAVAA